MRDSQEALTAGTGDLLGLFVERFGDLPPSFVCASAPGRLELAGNHTDHQGGCVISAAIEARSYALAAENGISQIRLFMEGFGEACVDLADEAWMEPVEDERGRSVSIVRGMAASFVKRGGAIRGFDAVTRSDIPAGFGVSSSAAFEMLMGACIEGLFGRDPSQVDRVEMALEGMRVERMYFGKPCGAQDQLSSAMGGVVAMDFRDEVPSAEHVPFDADACAYVPCLVDSRCDHSLYNDEFALVTRDMYDVAAWFGCGRLEEVGYERFAERLGEVRLELGDRRALRALHYFGETRRVREQRRCLERGDFEGFLVQARLSGASSAQYLQNVSPQGDGSGAAQPAMMILALCEHLLGDRGAWRIHGGGFGGSVLAFVPRERLGDFMARMNGYLGYEACWPVRFGGPGVQWERRMP